MKVCILNWFESVNVIDMDQWPNGLSEPFSTIQKTEVTNLSKIVELTYQYTQADVPDDWDLQHCSQIHKSHKIIQVYIIQVS
jgi:hypothetical protein